MKRTLFSLILIGLGIVLILWLSTTETKTIQDLSEKQLAQSTDSLKTKGSQNNKLSVPTEREMSQALDSGKEVVATDWKSRLSLTTPGSRSRKNLFELAARMENESLFRSLLKEGAWNPQDESALLEAAAYHKSDDIRSLGQDRLVANLQEGSFIQVFAQLQNTRHFPQMGKNWINHLCRFSSQDMAFESLKLKLNRLGIRTSDKDSSPLCESV